MASSRFENAPENPALFRSTLSDIADLGHVVVLIEELHDHHAAVKVEYSTTSTWIPSSGIDQTVGEASRSQSSG